MSDTGLGVVHQAVRLVLPWAVVVAQLVRERTRPLDQVAVLPQPRELDAV